MKLASLICLVLVMCACGNQRGNESSPIATTNTKETVSAPSPKQLNIRGTCVLKPENVVRLKSQLGGEVKSVLVQQGEKVKRGDVLATIDVAQLSLRHERLLIELQKLQLRVDLLQFQLSKAEKELTAARGSKGADSGNFSREMLTVVERRTDLKENEANQALAKLDLKVLETQLSKAAIRSPINGVLLSRSVEAGSVVGSGLDSLIGSEVLFEVADPDRLEAACIVKEADAAILISGLAVTMQISGEKSEILTGKVGRISPIISNQSGISRREFVVELAHKKTVPLFPGMNVEVDIETKQSVKKND